MENEEVKDELILEEFLPYRLAVLSHTVSSKIAGVYEERFQVSIPELGTITATTGAIRVDRIQKERWFSPGILPRAKP